MRADYAVRAGDLFADVDLARVAHATRVATYPGGLAAIVRQDQPGPWMYTGALENHAALVNRMASHRRLLGNGAEVLRRVRRPELVAAALRSAGLPCLDVVSRRKTVPGNGTWLCKPIRSAGGGGIAFHDGATTVDAQRASSSHFYQRYAAGPAYSAMYVAANGRCALLGITRQLIGADWAGARGFQYCGSIGPIEVPARVAESFARIGDLLAREFDLLGLFGVDAIVNEQGVWPVEVNPRYTASMELLDRACEVSAVRIHVAACESATLPDKVPRPRDQTCGKVVIFADRTMQVSADLSGPAAHDAARFAALADIPPAGTTIESGQPIVTILADARDEEGVLQILQRQAADMRAGSLLQSPTAAFR